MNRKIYRRAYVLYHKSPSEEFRKKESSALELAKKIVEEQARKSASRKDLEPKIVSSMWRDSCPESPPNHRSAWYSDSSDGKCFYYAWDSKNRRSSSRYGVVTTPDQTRLFAFRPRNSEKWIFVPMRDKYMNFFKRS